MMMIMMTHLAALLFLHLYPCLRRFWY